MCSVDTCSMRAAGRREEKQKHGLPPRNSYSDSFVFYRIQPSPSFTRLLMEKPSLGLKEAKLGRGW